MRKWVEFACKVADGKVIVYVDLDDGTVFSEIYPYEFATLNVRTFRKKLSEVSTQEILTYFKEIAEKYEKPEFFVHYDLLTVRVRDFDDFANAVWGVVVRAKKAKKEVESVK